MTSGLIYLPLLYLQEEPALAAAHAHLQQKQILSHPECYEPRTNCHHSFPSGPECIREKLYVESLFSDRP